MTLKKVVLLLIAGLAIFTVNAQKVEDAGQKTNALMVIDDFFKGFNNYDSASIRELFTAAALVKHVDPKSPQGFTQFSSHDFLKALSRAKNEKWEEHPVNYKMLMTHEIATIWVDYNFFLDKKLLHCGIDQFVLINTIKGWRISEITDTKNTEKCIPHSNINLVETERLRFDKASINSYLDEWHKAAAKADFDAYFGNLDSLSIFLGTDASERWTKDEFIKFAKPFFDKGKAWDFLPTERNITIEASGNHVWFDELLTTWMGTCRGSGVLEFMNNSWIIRQYNLTVTIPNDKIKNVIKLL